jgi:GTPase SAR1 family protein
MTTAPKDGIVMWGPHGSGKTCFLGALSKALSDISTANQLLDYRLSWAEKDGDHPLETGRAHLADVPDRWRSEYSEATEYHLHREYVFRCIRKRDRSEVARIYINAFDSKGSNLIAAVDPENPAGDSIVLSYLQEYNSYLVVFDLNELMNDRRANQLALGSLHNLCRYIGGKNEDGMVSNNGPRYNLAICLNKMDLIDMRWHDPGVIYHMTFGEPVSNLAHYHQTRVNTRVFATSVMGFYHRDLTEVSNFNGKDGPLVDERWMPWNVQAPFLWILGLMDSHLRQRESNWLTPLLTRQNSTPYFVEPYF